MNGRMSFAEVEEASDAFAVYLREGFGVKPGTRVAVQMPNCLSYPIAAFGVLKAGCVLVNVNPLYTAHEMQKQFADSGAEVLVIIDMFADKLAKALPGTPVKHVITTTISLLFPPVVRPIVYYVQKYWSRMIPACPVSGIFMTEALDTGRRLRQEKHIDPQGYWNDLGKSDLALLQYTGGTTGVAKGAMLTHGNLLANIRQIDSMGRSHIEDGQECVLTALPVYHVFAFSVNLLSFYMSGAHNILVPSPRPIQNLQRAIQNYPITWITGVNTLFNALLNEEWFTVYPPENLKASIAGGTALHRSVAERWRKATGTPLVEGYGLTESSPVVTFNPLTREPRPGSIGIPVPDTEVRLVDDDGYPVKPGTPGELVVRGPQVMAGYWEKPEETERTIRDGWLYTGDIAVMDRDGYLSIVDRKKDMILVSGFNVYPNEIEDCISKLDAVHEVAVIGVPDADTGEAVRAFIVKRDEITEDEIRTFCRQALARYKVPKQIEFRDELPTTPIGKVLRKDLRAEYLNRNR
jgi:long-chain acyl-CoA synthetase